MKNKQLAQKLGYNCYDTLSERVRKNTDNIIALYGRVPVFKGAWTTNTIYILGDLVEYDGSLYYVTADGFTSTNPPPQDTQNYALYLERGATGATGATGAVGPTGPTGDAALVYTEMIDPNSMPNLPLANFNRTPKVGDTFYALFGDTQYILAKIVTVAATTATIDIITGVIIKGADGVDALVYESILDAPIPHALPRSGFNRTPNVGDDFILLLSTGYIGMATITEALPNNDFAYTISSTTNITGPAGKDALIPTSFFTTTDDTPPAVLTFVPSNFNRSPVVGDHFQCTVVCADNKQYNCIYEVKTASEADIVQDVEYIAPSGGTWNAYTEIVPNTTISSYVPLPNWVRNGIGKTFAGIISFSLQPEAAGALACGSLTLGFVFTQSSASTISLTPQNIQATGIRSGSGMADRERITISLTVTNESTQSNLNVLVPDNLNVSVECEWLTIWGVV